MNLPMMAFVIFTILISAFLLYPVVVSFKARGQKITKLSGVIPESVQQQSRYLVYFWAPACGMCRGMTPVIDKLISQRYDVAKIDASEYPESARTLGVLGTPALVLIEGNVIVKVSLGAKSEAVILKMLSG